MAPELFELSDDEARCTRDAGASSFGIASIFAVSGSHTKFSLKNVSLGKLPELPKTLGVIFSVMRSNC